MSCTMVCYGSILLVSWSHPTASHVLQFVFKTAIGNSGIRFKVDPGVPLVYAGFLITILATLLSFKDHEQAGLVDMLCFAGT